MKVLLLPLAILTLIVTIYAVRALDNNRTSDIREELSCPHGHVLVMDTSRNFVCLTGVTPAETN